MEKQLRLQTIIAGVVALVVMVAGWAFWKFKMLDVVNADIVQKEAKLETDQKTAQDLAKNRKLAQIETGKLELAKAQLKYFQRRYRNIYFDDLTTDGGKDATWVRQMNEYFTNYGLELRRQLVDAARDSGVLLSTSAKVNDPPQVPEQVASPPSGFLKPLSNSNGAMDASIVGTMPNILNFFQRINREEILMGIGNVKLEGVSPVVKASFSITPYLVVAGPGAIVPSGGGTTSTTSTTTPQPGATPSSSTGSG